MTTDVRNEAIYTEIQRLMGEPAGKLALEAGDQGLDVWKIAFGFTFAALAVLEQITDPVDRASVAEALSSSFTFQCRAMADEALAASKPPPPSQQH